MKPCDLKYSKLELIRWIIFTWKLLFLAQCNISGAMEITTLSYPISTHVNEEYFKKNLPSTYFLIFSFMRITKNTSTT